MKSYIKKAKNYFSHSKPIKVAVYLAIFLILVIFGLGLPFLIPKANFSSVQVGLTLVAQTLGVLFGAVLVIVGFLVEQRRQAENFLKRIFGKYYSLIRSKSELVNRGRQELIGAVKKENISLDAPIFEAPDGFPSKEKYRDAIGNLTSLTYVFHPDLMEELEKDMKKLGFSQSECDDYIFGKGVIADYEPIKFLKLVGDALDLNFLAPHCSNDVSDLSAEIFRQSMQDGISDIVSKYEKSDRVLKSKILVSDIIILPVAVVCAVMVLFGVTSQTILLSYFEWLIKTIIFCFIITIFLTLFLIKEIVDS